MPHTLKFYGGPYDGFVVQDGDAIVRYSPYGPGSCLLSPKGHAYGYIGEENGVVSFKFVKALSESERRAMKVCEFKGES